MTNDKTIAPQGPKPDGVVEALTDERAHEILESMALEIEAWMKKLNQAPSPAECSGKAVSIIRAALLRHEAAGGDGILNDRDSRPIGGQDGGKKEC